MKNKDVYSLYVKETKTGKASGYFISKSIYDYVQKIKAQRIEWVNSQS